MRSRWSVPVLIAVFAVACAAPENAATESNAPPPQRLPVVSTPVEPTTTTAAPLAPTVSDVVPAAVTPVFAAVISEVGEEELGSSWQVGCPVAVDDLRRVDLSHWDDDGNAIEGVLVLHVDHVADVVTVFDRLFEAGYPIHSMRLITDFGADDDVSMAANNSSGFNCREVAGRPGQWSQHAYGGAIDINPLVNPWVRGSLVDPPGGAPYVDRSVSALGLITAGDVVTQVFADIGWIWGGDWTATVDYQHFSHNGR